MFSVGGPAVVRRCHPLESAVRQGETSGLTPLFTCDRKDADAGTAGSGEDDVHASCQEKFPVRR